jgi:hypothetical protein
MTGKEHDLDHLSVHGCRYEYEHLHENEYNVLTHIVTEPNMETDDGDD